MWRSLPTWSSRCSRPATGDAARAVGSLAVGAGDGPPSVLEAALYRPGPVRPVGPPVPVGARRRAGSLARPVGLRAARRGAGRAPVRVARRGVAGVARHSGRVGGPALDGAPWGSCGSSRMRAGRAGAVVLVEASTCRCARSRVAGCVNRSMRRSSRSGGSRPTSWTGRRVTRTHRLMFGRS